MLEYYNRLSISKKLNFMSITTVLIAGTFSIVFILLYQYFNEKAKLEYANKIFTKILAKNIAPAVLFNDMQSAKDLLKSLEYDAKIKQAYIMDSEWNLLESYSHKKNSSLANELLSTLNSSSEQFWVDWDLYTISPIVIEEKNIGSLVIVSSLDEFVYSMFSDAFFIFLCILLGLPLAYKYHSVLSREILLPVSKLNESANIIIQTKALTARVGVYNDDEIGELAKNFNVMLDKLYKSHEELQKQKDLLAYKAHHDALTGLPNRVLFNDRLELAVARAFRNKSIFSVFFLDLDYFKEINDKYGHDMGDKVLKICSQRLKDSIRAEDTLARISGDEFMIILEDHTNPKTSEFVALKIIDAMKEPFVFDENILKITVSIGISFYPKDAQEPCELIKNSDLAMYDAKKNGRNNFKFYRSK